VRIWNIEQGEGISNNEQGMTIGEGKIVRGDGVKSIVRITQFTYSLINEFPNKRITIGEVIFLMPGTTKITNKTAPKVRPFNRRLSKKYGWL